MIYFTRYLSLVLLLLITGPFPHARADLGESSVDAGRQAPDSINAARASTRQGEAQLAQRSEQAGGWGLPNPKKLKTYEVGYLWEGDELAAEIHSKEGTRVHVHRPGTFVPLLQAEGGEVFHVISDHLGTPKELVDEGGRVTWSAAHGAWNQIQEQWFDDAHPRGRRVASPFRGLGQYYDVETQLSCTRYRYWEAGTGRWLSADPMDIVGGANLFGFDGAPQLDVDPLGLSHAPWSPHGAAEPDIISKGSHFNASGPERVELSVVTDKDGKVDFKPAFSKYKQKNVDSAIKAAHERFRTDAAWRATLLESAKKVKENLFTNHDDLEKAREMKKVQKAIKRQMTELEKPPCQR
jgi:RHS repeat-associated protein